MSLVTSPSRSRAAGKPTSAARSWETALLHGHVAPEIHMQGFGPRPNSSLRRRLLPSVVLLITPFLLSAPSAGCGGGRICREAGATCANGEACCSFRCNVREGEVVGTCAARAGDLFSP